MSYFEKDAIISGIGISRIGRRTGIPRLELTMESVRAAIEDAGIAPHEVDSTFVSLFNNGFSAQDFPASLVLQHVPELTDVVAWSDRLPSVAAGIEVPVRAALAEHDNIWQSDQAARTALRQRFTRCRSIRVESFPGAGHSIELHRGARAYVLRQLAFAEECLSALSGAANVSRSRANAHCAAGTPARAAGKVLNAVRHPRRDPVPVRGRWPDVTPYIPVTGCGPARRAEDHPAVIGDLVADASKMILETGVLPGQNGALRISIWLICAR